MNQKEHNNADASPIAINDHNPLLPTSSGESEAGNDDVNHLTEALSKSGQVCLIEQPKIDALSSTAIPTPVADINSILNLGTATEEVGKSHEAVVADSKKSTGKGRKGCILF